MLTIPQMRDLGRAKNIYLHGLEVISLTIFMIIGYLYFCTIHHSLIRAARIYLVIRGRILKGFFLNFSRDCTVATLN